MPLRWRRDFFETMAVDKCTLIYSTVVFLVSGIGNINAQSCGGDYTTDYGVFMSPNYPNVYPLSAECIYRIMPSVISSITLNFETFELDRSSGDYVSVTCESDTSYVTKNFTYSSFVPPISMPSCSIARLYFYSDSSSPFPTRGFRVQYQVDTEGCANTVFISHNGTISSPNYPQNYNSDENCTYSVVAPTSSSFNLNFQAFDLESDCERDWVQIRCDNSSYILPKYCGSTLPKPAFIRNCKKVLIWFHTDSSGVSSGFSLQYSVTPDGCGKKEYAGLSGIITSPNYPQTYNNVSCYYHLLVVSSVSLAFQAFDLEPYIDYGYGDFLEIELLLTNGTTLSHRYVGNSLLPLISCTMCYRVHFFFKTFHGFSGTGFNVRYQVNPLVAHSAITSSPKNFTVEVGSRVELTCTSDAIDYYPSWTLSTDGTDENTTVLSMYCYFTYADGPYSITKGGPGVCNLVITNATLAEAGIYTCIDVGLSSSSSVVTVIEDPCDFYTGATTISSGTSTVGFINDRPCLDRPCLNGATCVENCTTFTCICTEGYTGYICDVEINECETIPCYPFGDCVDFIGGYSCGCKGGYESFNDTMCTETDFCANETQPCNNGGTCVSQNALSRYYCICPEIDGKPQYVGLHCEFVLTTVTRPTVNIGGISPTSGIIAGGANVIISGKGMASFQPLGAYLVDTTASPLPSLYAYVYPNLTSNDSITVQIPPAHGGYINRSLVMFVEYSGPLNVTDATHNLIFKYTGNPVIHAIEPTDILVTGGVRLTVSGANMDSAQNPVMEITTFVDNKTMGRLDTEYKEICLQKNSSAITCLIPYGIVPPSFINNTAPAGKSLRGVFHLDSSLWAHKIGRRTKRAPVANLTDETGNSFEMYLGFIFDAFPTYENISKSLPNITLNFVPLQVSFDPSCSMDFVTNKMDTISLSGTDLTYGCSMEDYEVFISNVTCVITSLTDSMLECRPPEDEPTINDPSAYCAHSSDPHPIKITVGGMTYHGCCVSYTTDYTDLIIGVTVICVVVVAIIILVAVLLYKRHKKNQAVKKANYRASVKSKEENEYDSVVGPPNGNDDAVLTHDRSYAGANHGKQTVAAMAMAPQRGHPTAVQPDHDDYMQPKDIPAVFDNHGGVGDADIRGDSSGRTHDSYANAGLYGHRGEQPVEDYGVAIRRHREPGIDNLMEIDPEIDY